MEVHNHSTIVVLQGEVAVEQSREGADLFLKAPVPKQSIVFTLFDTERKITAMAYVDDYISVQDVINRIEVLLRQKFETTLTSAQFVAKVMGGTDDDFSLEQKQSIVDAFKNLKITTEQVDLSKGGKERPQIALNTRNGEHIHFRGEEINRGLEYLQRREYGDFNTFLDTRFASLDGSDIPFFEAKEARRLERDIPQAPEKLSVSFVLKPSDARASASQTSSEWMQKYQGAEHLGFIKIKTSPERTPIADPDKTKVRVWQSVSKTFSTFPHLKCSHEDCDYNVMLRRAAADSKCFEVFKLLLQNASALSLDLTARGEKHGTVWDVAKTFSNTQALELLKTI